VETREREREKDRERKRERLREKERERKREKEIKIKRERERERDRRHSGAWGSITGAPICSKSGTFRDCSLLRPLEQRSQILAKWQNCEN
jgi:hypothetical protein